MDFVSIQEMIADLLPQTITSIQNTQQDLIKVLVDGGEDPYSFWFEVWQFRELHPPRQLFVSNQQYPCLSSALKDGQRFLDEVIKISL